MSFVCMCIWALATVALAPLPMKYQIVPGIGLLLAFSPLLIWLAYDYGALAWPVCVVAAVSLFRKPVAAGFLALKRRFTRE